VLCRAGITSLQGNPVSVSDEYLYVTPCNKVFYKEIIFAVFEVVFFAESYQVALGL